MLKTISAALLAVSVLAAPAMAASSDKTAQAPATKSVQVKPSVLNAKQAKPNALSAKQVKPNALNANAKMGRHHRHHSHHRAHKKMTALKTHQVSKGTIKHVTPATKRG